MPVDIFIYAIFFKDNEISAIILQHSYTTSLSQKDFTYWLIYLSHIYLYKLNN